VDIVHGHSSHHVKGIEVHRGKLILYGCGDFIDDYEGIKGYEAFRDDLVPARIINVGPCRDRTIKRHNNHLSQRQRGSVTSAPRYSNLEAEWTIR